MPKITIKRPVEVEAVFLKAECGVRYWDDGEINGVADGEDVPLMPFSNPSREEWAIIIDLEEGRIVDWPQGTSASVHYKVCDAGRYSLLDADKGELITIDGYVPRIMSPKENGYGDYVIMDIGADGKIADWRIDLDAFTSDED
jgi:hypothetical protein